MYNRTKRKGFHRLNKIQGTTTMTITITFTKKEKEFIKRVAQLRTIETEGKRDIKAYGSVTKFFDCFENNVVAIMTEAAVVKFMGLDLTKTPLEVWPSFYIAEHKSFYDGSDVRIDGQNYEVRRTNKKDNPLAVRSKDVKENTINIKTFIEYKEPVAGQKVPLEDIVPVVYLMGWIHSSAYHDDSLSETPWWAKRQGTDDRVVTDANLNPMETLLKQEALV